MDIEEPEGVKLAVMVFALSIVKNPVGLVVPVTEPLQWEKEYPDAGMASRLLVAPSAELITTG